MRPLLLELQNIGPFRQQTIDFTQLSDMFLVCGKTGAGKSTIFKAITYGIYGKLPGSHSQVRGEQIRSDFASPLDEAIITLTFVLHNKCYKVQRSLPHTYINRQGVESSKVEAVQLLKKEGEEFILVNNKKSETDTTLQSLMGLTVEEFARIILLPQGEFAEFLKQKSSDRRETLLKLFPINHYEELTQTIKDKNTQVATQLKTLEEQLSQFGDFNLQQEEEKLKTFQEALNNSQARRKELQDSRRKTELELHIKQELQKNFIAHGQLQNQLLEHTSKEDQIQEYKEQITSGEGAAPVYLKIKDWEKAQAAQAESLKQLEATKQRIVALEEKQQELQNQGPHFQQLQKTYEKNLGLQQELVRGLNQEQEVASLKNKVKTTANSLEALTNQLATLAKRKIQIEEALNQLPEASIQQVNAVHQQLMQLTQGLQETKTKLQEAQEAQNLKEKILLQEERVRESQTKTKKAQEELQEQVKKLETQREQNYAQVLATTLKPGCPCPVCGSTNHSNQLSLHLETLSQGELEEQAQVVRQLEVAVAEAQQQSTKEATILEQVQQQLDNLPATNTTDELEAQIKELEEKINQEKAKQGGLNKTLSQKDRLNKELQENLAEKEPLEQKTNSIQQELASLESQIKEKEASLQQMLNSAQEGGFQGSSVKEVQTKVSDWMAKTRDAINQYRKTLEEVQQNLSGDKARSQEQEERQNQCQKEVEQTREEMEQSLTLSGFTSIDEVRAAYRSPEEIQNLRGRVEQWQNEHTRLTSQVQEVEKKLTGSQQETEQEILFLQDSIQNLEQEIQQLENSHNLALQQLEKVKSTITRWKELETQRTECLTTASLYNQLYTDISDKNPKRLALTTWILSIYLDQIIACANGRLYTISEGRYSLHFLQEGGGRGARGLDLEILDSYTGKKRPCATLSGGETFMVSISLALALTDVVCNRRGGISLQSLFIDEGFGSLDPTSLDKALSILEEVREGRMVGVISHVQEMQNRIPCRLEVIKTSTGSSVKIIGED